MTSDPSLSRRVSRLENETESIYELIDDLRGEMRSGFRAVDQRLDTVDQRLDTVDRRLDTVDQRLGSIDTTLAELVRRLPERS